MIDVEKLKLQIDLRQLVERDLGKPRFRGCDYAAFKCPLHGEYKGCSLAVYAHHWQCFGKCHAGGDAIAWIQHYHRLPFHADMHDDFAQYLVDITRHLIEGEGIPVRWISPINEPQWDWQPSKGQEGTHYTTDEIISVLLALQNTIDQSGLDVEISAIEAGEWGSAAIYARRIYDEPILAAALDHFAVHSYWSSPDDKAQFADFMARHYPGVPLWMSEWTEMQQGRDYGMDSALFMANVIHDDLTIGGVTSWQYWIAVSKYNFRDGLIYTREYGEQIELTKRLWVLGNYSRYIQPDAVRLDVTSDNELVRTSAYRAPDSGSVTFVVINNSADRQSITLAGLDSGARTLDIYETSEANDLTLIYSGTPQADYELAPSSVTTFVFQVHQGG